MSDKEAFNKWWEENIGNYEVRTDTYMSWQAAIEYSNQKHLKGTVLKIYNEKYEAEKAKSRKLVEALNTIDKRLDNADVINPGGIVHAMIKTRLADYNKEEI